MTRTPLIASLFLLGACIPDTGVPAPVFASLGGPTAVSLAAHPGYLTYADGLAFLAALDFQIMNDISGEPMPDIQVEVFSSFPGVFLLPTTAVSVVSRPEEPEVPCTEAWDPSLCPWQDPSTNTYYALANDYGMGDLDAYRPTYFIQPTDDRGLVRAWAFIDQMPWGVDAAELDSGGLYDLSAVIWGDVGITASIGHATLVTVVSVETDG